ncbi:MAG: EAL domain-containing protein [Burkholderiaceae bacterium]
MDGRVIGEELRETIIAMGRELDMLRTEARHANLLLSALDSILAVGPEQDPFIGVFAAVQSIFDYSHALVLVELAHALGVDPPAATGAGDGDGDGDGDRPASGDHAMVLQCMSASHERLIGTVWPIDRMLSKVLAGRVLTTISTPDGQAWPEEALAIVNRRQPALYLPLRVRDRRGLLMMLREPDSPGFDRSHVNLARKFSVLASHAFAASRAHQTEVESYRLKRLAEELEASQEALTYRANHDQLTGLANRVHIHELVNARIAALRPGEQLALAFIDIDHFKQVNDYYGHAAGDALLKGVAERMRAEIRANDIVGRISGDEFVMALAPITECSQLTGLIERLRERLREPFDIDGQSLQASATIGVSVYPSHGHDYETLKRKADMAMYHVKSSGKGGVGYFDEALGRSAIERMSLERRLRTALDNSQFTYVLQPKVDIRDGKVIGFEALARWIDDTGAVQPPARFLSAAIEMGLLDCITHTIADALIRDLPRLDACFGPDITYSLNIAAQQAAKPQFMENLVHRVGTHGPRLMFELTEENFVAAGLFQSRVLPLLREAGIGVSIDDFGTGFSCLSILADITADELKVDRSLIASIHLRPRSQSILRAIASLSGALGMNVVAEGIETEQERAYLLEATRIAVGQGFLFSRPCSVDELIRSHRREPLPLAGT